MHSKTLIFLQTVVIGILSFLVFKCYIETPEDGCKPKKDTNILKTITSSKHLLDEDKVKALYNNYQDRFIPTIKTIQDNVEFPNGEARHDYKPTEYSLIPLQKLKDYIAFIDVLQDKNPGQKISGIAISFGAYDFDKDVSKDKSDKSALKDPMRRGDYRGRMTTWFTPTFFDESIDSNYDAAKHVPFYIESNGDDPYIGTYKSLFCYLGQEDKCYNRVQENKASIFSLLNTTNVVTGDAVVVSYNEFTDMPPLKPKGNQ